MVPLTRIIGEFVSDLRFAAIPPAAVHSVCHGFTDAAACMIAGRGAPVVAAIRSVVGEAETGAARLLFSAARATAPLAALVNGTAAHALDYDDIGIGAHPAHPSAVMVPAILAEAEMLGSNGRDMITAYVAGYEVWGDLARRDANPHHVKGWHPTGMFGALAAAAACARLRGLDGAHAAHAVGIAAAQASGLVGNFGSMAKPFQAGHPAQIGVFSARLAAAGMTASRDVLERRDGFLHAVSPRGVVDVESPAIFGREWWMLRNGLGFKLFPMCYGAHRSLDGMLQLVAEHDLTPGQVAGIDVDMSPNQQINLVNHDPQTGNEAKFSEQFAMAMAIIARRATMAELTDEFVQRADVRALMRKVRITTIAAVGDDRPTTPPNDRISVTLRDGRVLQRWLDHPRGHAKSPLMGDELWSKFADCIGNALPPEATRHFFDQLQALDQIGAVSEFPVIANDRVEQVPHG